MYCKVLWVSDSRNLQNELLSVVHRESSLAISKEILSENGGNSYDAAWLIACAGGPEVFS